MGRPPLEKKQRQIAVALPSDVRDELEKAAVGEGHSLAEEIRRRIDRTLYEDGFDQKTRELAADIMEIANELHRQTGVTWHLNRGAHQALVEAVRWWLDSIKPPVDDSAAVSDLLVGDPLTRGQSVAQSWQRIKAEMAKSHQEILDLHEGDKS